MGGGIILLTLHGDDDEIAYSEELSLLFLRYLRQGASVGDALRQAKVADIVRAIRSLLHRTQHQGLDQMVILAFFDRAG